MDDVINTLMEIRNAIQHIEQFVPTEHNCKQILGSIQRLDITIEYLRHIHIKENTDGEQTN